MPVRSPRVRIVRRLGTQLPGLTTLLMLLERRLDNTVFRLGFARTIPAARQLISHGHIRVGDQRVDRPGYLLEVGETISLAPQARERESLRTVAEQGPLLRLPSFLRSDPDDTCSGRVVSRPARADVPFPVTEALIIEFYAR